MLLGWIGGLIVIWMLVGCIYVIGSLLNGCDHATHEKENQTLQGIEMETSRKEVIDILNGGMTICCDRCHSMDYDVYPTGIAIHPETGEIDPNNDINDIWFRCNKCGNTWPSGFAKNVRRSKLGM